MKFLPIFVSIILTVFCATTVSIYVYAENEEYHDDEYNFSIQYPENWTLIDNSDDDNKYPARALEIYANIVDDGFPGPNSSIGKILYTPTLYVNIFPDTKDIKNIVELIKEDRKQSKNIWNLTEAEDEKFGKIYKLTLTGFFEDIPKRSIENTFITKGKHVFMFIYTTPTEYFDVYKDRIDEIIHSIKFKK